MTSLARFPTTIFLMFALVSTVSAGVIRHDVDTSLYTSLAAETDFDSVGSITGSAAAFSYSGSATLIASNWVLTAAHVVDQAMDLTFGLGGQSFKASRWIAHSDWNGDLGKGYDIGLIEFSQDIAAITGVDPARLYTGTSEVGQRAVSVGYGRTGTGVDGDIFGAGTKRAGENMVDALLRTPGRSDRVLLSDFDNPDDSGDSSWGSSNPLPLEYLIAPGDSGGGLFLGLDGDYYLAGVHSFGWGVLDGDPNSDYGDASGHTRVSAFTGWIESVIGTGQNGGGNGGTQKDKPNKGRPMVHTAFGNTEYVNQLDVNQIPEPTSLALFGLGLVGFRFSRR